MGRRLGTATVKRWTLAAVLCVLVNGAPGAFAEPAVHSPSELARYVDAALARDPAQELLPLLEQEAAALARHSHSWFSEGPVGSVYWQDDAALTDDGLREAEAGLEWPLWWPRAREAARILAEASAAEANLHPRYQRWLATAVVRERLWMLATAEAALAQAKEAELSSRLLHEQVTARVRAGDLAQADQLMSEQEMLGRAAERQAAERDWLTQRAGFELLVGLPADLRDLTPERVADIESDAHPGLALLAQKVKRAEAEWQQLRARGAGAPILQIGGRRERGSRDEPAIDSLGMGLRVPFGGAVAKSPDRAAAQRAWGEARLQWRQALRDHAVSRQEAQAALQQALEIQPLVERRAELAQRQQDLAQAAFAAGELDLMDLLRIREQARLTIRESERQHLTIGWSTARLNQILGDVP